MGRRKQGQTSVSNECECSLLDPVGVEREKDQPKTVCQHIARAVDINHVKKKLNSDNLKSIICTICRKEGVPPRKEENWICLQCGDRQCCLDHLKVHFSIPRSDTHAVGFSLSNFDTWCDLCSSLLPVDDFKRLKICVGFIKQTMDKSKPSQTTENHDDDAPPPLVEWNDSNESSTSKTSQTINRQKLKEHPSVRGLANLGNTCFFNSVLQCLARTPKLVETLRRLEVEKEPISITLKNGKRLEGFLEKSGDWLGQCLADTLVALCRPGDTSSENPLRLLELLRKKCPQFEGYEQHDAHELLRHLLDNVRQNDLKRYRSLMLNELGLNCKVNPQNVSAELHKKAKALDNEVVERVTLVPEHVFKGLLVSTLKCQDCMHTSNCVESFLDLSLPIMADKPQPPSMARRKSSASPELVDDKASGISKHQMKKQAKQRKRVRRYCGHKTSAASSGDGGMPQALDSHSDKGESEADVEDNEEEKPQESGYSSEKILSESSSLSGGDDSSRTSPTSHVKEMRSSNKSRVEVCEGLPLVNNGTEVTTGGLITQAQYVPFPRSRRKPSDKWIGADGSLAPNWIPHTDNTYLPTPETVMIGGESWRNYAARNGLSPGPGRYKKDVPLNPIAEEESNRWKGERSVCDQVSLINRVVEPMLAQVHIYQRDLDKCDDASLTSSRVAAENLSDDISRFNPFNNEDCGRTEGVHPNDSKGTMAEPNERVPIPDDAPHKERLSPDTVTDDTSNGFRVDTSNSRSKFPCLSLPKQEENLSIIGPTDDRLLDNKKKDSDDDKESINISPLFLSDSFKEKEPVKVEKKEETDMKYRRKTRERESGYRNPESESECSVQSCLSQFTAVEIMSGANKVGCSVCTQRNNKGNKEGKMVNTIASKQLLIKQTPQVLILHLKRFQLQMYAFRKLSKHVSFPLDLDISPFCLPEVERDDEGKIMYSLYGVVEHSGSLNAGHYVAYVKVEEAEGSCWRWYCISDSYVHEVAEGRVLQSQAYLLFYKRLR